MNRLASPGEVSKFANQTTDLERAALMCEGRSASLFAGGFFNAANEAQKCADAIRRMDVVFQAIRSRDPRIEARDREEPTAEEIRTAIETVRGGLPVDLGHRRSEA